MTNAQKLALQLSVAAGRLNEIGLLTGDAYSEEIRSEETKLQTESRETRTRYESALIAEGDDAHKAGSQFGAGDSAEDRAYRELTGKANVGRMIMAVMEHRAADGADARAAKTPWAGSESDPDWTCYGHRLMSIGPSRLHSRTSARRSNPFEMPTFSYRARVRSFGIDRPTVAMGDAVFPVLTTRPTVGGPYADSTDVPETTGGFDADLIGPARVQASFIKKRTDAARFSLALDSSPCGWRSMPGSKRSWTMRPSRATKVCCTAQILMINDQHRDGGVCRLSQSLLPMRAWTVGTRRKQPTYGPSSG